MTALASRHNERAAEALPDARSAVAPGRPARLDTEAATTTALDAALPLTPADGGLWTAPKVARWIQARNRHGRQPQYGVENHTPPSALPVRCHVHIIIGVRRRASRVQKKLGETITNLACAHPADTVELWTQDEARLGLKPIRASAVVAARHSPHRHRASGLRMTVVVCGGASGIGGVFGLVLPYLNAPLMQRFLDEFARPHATTGRRIVRVMDGATAHRANSLRVPARITLVQLPRYTPELKRD